MANDDEEMPELATNEEWRAIMMRARKQQQLSQEQLGKIVGLSQVMISKLESGESGSSTYVLRICRTLSIAEPKHYADEDSQSWSELGHVLRHRAPEEYEAILHLVEATAKRIRETQEGDETPPHSEPRTGRQK